MTVARPPTTWTAPSVEAALERVAKKVLALARRLRSRLQAQGDDEAAPGASHSRVFLDVRAPGLEAVVRLSYGLRRCPEKAGGMDLLVEFRQVPLTTDAELAEAARASTPDRYWALIDTIKAVTVHIRVGGARPRLDPRWQRAVRQADRWRFGHGPSPLEDFRDRRQRKDDQETAMFLDAELADLPPEVKQRRDGRETFWWRTLWINPARQTSEDVLFLLALVLLQEGIVPSAKNALETRAVSYIKGLAKRVSDGIAFLILDDLRRNFTEPEDWRALARYIRRTARGKRDDRDGVQERDKRHVRRAPPRDDRIHEQLDADHARARLTRRHRRDKAPVLPDERGGTLSVAAVASQLAVSRDALYDWIASGKVRARFEGRLTLDAEGQARVRELLEERELRRKIRAWFVGRGKTAAAAKKFIYRKRWAGASLATILRELHGHNNDGHPRRASRIRD